MTFHDPSVQRPYPDSLFHYTRASGLLGIVQNQTLWATDVRFLNDAEEATYGYKPMYEAIKSIDNPVQDPNHWAHKMEINAQETGHKYGPAEHFEVYRRTLLSTLRESSFGVYTTCFCESGDLLSQWRAYGTDHGYSIEFGSEGLAAALKGLSTAAFDLVSVRYGPEASRQVIAATVAQVLDFNLNHPGTKAMNMAALVTSRLASLKNPDFAEEQEWRMLVTYLPSQQGPPSAQYDPRQASMFRATAMAIVPYIAIPFPSGALKSVRVGPGNYADIREAGVRRLLKSVGSTADVYRSNTPLRS